MEAENKQVIFKGFVEGTPKETDLQVKPGISIKLKAPKGSGAFLVKNLYLSCDPYMRGRMRDFRDSYIPPFVPGQVFLSFTLISLFAICFSFHFLYFILVAPEEFTHVLFHFKVPTA